jgi:DNA-directed RNA polymerase sigma subunit (sigma70/sigma32)
LNFPFFDVAEMRETCSLDVAEGGTHSLETVGRLVNLTRERIRQIEVAAMAAMRGPIRRVTR